MTAPATAKVVLGYSAVRGNSDPAGHIPHGRGSQEDKEHEGRVLRKRDCTVGRAPGYTEDPLESAAEDSIPV